MAFFFIGLIEAMIRRRKAEANPWGEGATTLEWTLSSPPPFHQFNDLPRVSKPGPPAPAPRPERRRRDRCPT